MNNKKCPNCGFINFLKDEACRKCETSLDGPAIAEPSYGASAPYANAPSYATAPSYGTVPSYGNASSYAAAAPNPYATSAPGYSAAAPNSYAAGQQYYQYRTTPEKKGFPVLKVTVGLVIGFVILAGLTGAGATFLKRNAKVQWQEFRANGSSVVVMMPKQPRAHEAVVTPLPNGSITNHTYTATIIGQGSTMFVVVDFTFNFEVAQSSYQKMVDAEFDDLLKRTDAVVINRQNISVNGFPGVQFETTSLDGVNKTDRRSFGKMFMAKNRLYLLAITASENSELLKGKDGFLNCQVPPS